MKLYIIGHKNTSKYFCASLQQMLTDFDRNWCALSWRNKPHSTIKLIYFKRFIYLKRLLRDTNHSNKQTFTSFHFSLSKQLLLGFCKVVWQRI